MSTKLSKITADFNTQLSASVSIGGTTFSLQTNIDDDGVTIPNGQYLFAVDSANSLKEFFSGTLTGLVVTALKSVSRQGVETSGAIRSHTVGASVIIGNFPALVFINNLVTGVDGFNSSVPLGYDATATISTANQIATKAYTDAQVIPAPTTDATTAVKGIMRTSVAPAVANTPIVLGDNDPKLPTQDENDAMVGTSGAPSSSNKFVTAEDTNYLTTIKTTGTENIGGIKTFTSIPVLPASDPISANDMVRKAYADATI